MGGDHDRASGPLASAAEDTAVPSAAGNPAPAAAESPGADALPDVLEAVRLTGALFFIVEASPPWIAEAPDSPALAPVILPRVQHVVSYHVVTRGTCWCHMAGVAREVGYESEAAFSRAFKKLTGVAPAPWRHRQATTAQQGRS